MFLGFYTHYSLAELSPLTLFITLTLTPPWSHRAAKSGLRQAPTVVAELLAARPQPARVDLQNRHFQTALMMAVCVSV